MRLSASQYATPRQQQHTDGRDEAKRQVQESLAFMRFQSQGHSWAESMRMARELVAANFR